MSKKRGFSIIEVVIALTVIVIVTFSALSIILASTTKRVSAINETEGQQFASDVLECFKASSSFSAFQNNVYFALGESIDDTKWETKIETVENEEKKVWELDDDEWYTYDKSGVFKAKIKVDYESPRPKIAIVVMKNKTEIEDFGKVIKFDEKNLIFVIEDKNVEKDLIISFTYQKGQGGGQ